MMRLQKNRVFTPPPPAPHTHKTFLAIDIERLLIITKSIYLQYFEHYLYMHMMSFLSMTASSIEKERLAAKL
jgi:hypothetical protein